MRAALALAFLFAQGIAPAMAQACRERAMIVFDASSSMSALHAGRSRIDLAREALGDVLPDVARRRPTGLITFGGHGPPCADVILKVPPAMDNDRRIMSALRNMRALGATEIESSVDEAAKVLRKGNAPGIIVLVTDGMELCGRDVCRLADRLGAKASVPIRVHVIGFHLRARAAKTLTCLADATGGTYAETMSLARLRQALRAVLGCARVSQLTQGSRRSSVATP